jgi:Ser/Thr protein kinase RdoA (MazF antagonist)
MALFYVLPHHCTSPEDLAHAETFLAEFWKGYQSSGELEPAWLRQIPLFLRLREIDLYIIIHRSMDINNLDPWCASFMKDRRQKILAGTPYCPLDISRIG